MQKRFKILNIWVDAVTLSEAKDRVVDILRRGKRPHGIFAANPEKNFSVPKDPALYRIYRSADILLPDGIGMVIAARVLYHKKIKRIPGVEFMMTLCRLAAAEGKSVFLYGAKEEINRAAAEKLQRQIPALCIAGRCNGYVKAGDMPDLIDQINRSGARVLFLALGSPRQEKWFACYKDALTQVVLVQGIGGTLDAIAGNVKRAPEFWQKFALEWFYRLISEPKRLKRQLVLPVFAWQVLLARIGR